DALDGAVAEICVAQLLGRAALLHPLTILPVVGSPRPLGIEDPESSGAGRRGGGRRVRRLGSVLAGPETHRIRLREAGRTCRRNAERVDEEEILVRVDRKLVLLEIADPPRLAMSVGTEHAHVNLVRVRAGTVGGKR